MNADIVGRLRQELTDRADGFGPPRLTDIESADLTVAGSSRARRRRLAGGLVPLLGGAIAVPLLLASGDPVGSCRDLPLAPSGTSSTPLAGAMDAPVAGDVTSGPPVSTVPDGPAPRSAVAVNGQILGFDSGRACVLAVAGPVLGGQADMAGALPTTADGRVVLVQRPDGEPNRLAVTQPDGRVRVLADEIVADIAVSADRTRVGYVRRDAGAWRAVVATLPDGRPVLDVQLTSALSASSLLADGRLIVQDDQAGPLQVLDGAGSTVVLPAAYTAARGTDTAGRVYLVREPEGGDPPVAPHHDGRLVCTVPSRIASDGAVTETGPCIGDMYVPSPDGAQLVHREGTYASNIVVTDPDGGAEAVRFALPVDSGLNGLAWEDNDAVLVQSVQTGGWEGPGPGPFLLRCVLATGVCERTLTVSPDAEYPLLVAPAPEGTSRAEGAPVS